MIEVGNPLAGEAPGQAFGQRFPGMQEEKAVRCAENRATAKLYAGLLISER